MEELKQLRQDIQKIDEQMQDLFVKRMECVLKIKEIKLKNHLPITQSEIEKQKKERLLQCLKNKNIEKEYLDFFDKILDLSKQIQNKGD